MSGIRRFSVRHNFIIGICIPAILLAAFSFLRLDAAENMELLFVNQFVQRMQLPPVEEKLVLILGSDRSIQEVGMWPWPRNTYIKLLDERLSRARMVAFDILFVDESTSGGDVALADAFRRHGNVVLCYAEAVDGKSVLHSLPILIESAAGEGYSNAFRDRDGIMRHYRFLEQKQILAPSFVCAAAMASGYQFDWDYSGTGAMLHVTAPNGASHSLAVDATMQFLRFPSPTGSVQVYEMSDVLNGKIAADAFDDAIVMLGFNASGATDVVNAADGLVSGTKYNIDSLYTLLAGVSPKRAPAALEAAVTVLLFLLCLLLASKPRIQYSVFVLLLLPVLWISVTAALFLSGTLWLCSFLPLVAIVIGYALAIVHQLLRSQRDLRVRSLSMDSLLDLSQSLGEAAEFETFPAYLTMLAREIEAATELHIIAPLLDETAPERARFPQEDASGGLIIAYNAAPPPYIHQILVALPLLDAENGQPQYTLLGMRTKVPAATVKSVATVIVTAYVYFHASKDAAKRSEMFYAMIQCMISAIDAKDPITSGHSQRVAELSERIATWMGLPEDKVKEIKFSGMIHDIGKIGIADRILGKPGPFSDADFKAMKEHPAKGGAIMQAVNLQPEILNGVLHHHERPDGKGYPYGKSGDEISIAAHIIKVADVYDALCSERQYKKAWPVARALNILYEGRGTEFDGGIVDTVIAHLKPDDWQPPEVRPFTVSAPNAYVLEKYKSLIAFFRDAAQASCPDGQPAFAGRYAGGADILCQNEFYSVDWYDGYNQNDFLYQKPQLVYAQDDIIVFALGHPGGGYLLYYFLRGFLTAGAHICADSAQPPLEQEFGSPLYADKDVTLWDARRMTVLFTQKTENTPPAIFYIMKSILEESST